MLCICAHSYMHANTCNWHVLQNTSNNKDLYIARMNGDPSQNFMQVVVGNESLKKITANLECTRA